MMEVDTIISLGYVMGMSKLERLNVQEVQILEARGILLLTLME